MVPAMLAVMLWRYDEYAQTHADHAAVAESPGSWDGVPGGERVELAACR